MTVADPNNERAAARVHYFERQFLRLQDFTDEQAYHLAALRRHQIAHHVWGIVYGLDLNRDPDGNLAVFPGVAIDGYGRDLVLPYGQTLPVSAFDDQLSDTLDAWLIYNRVESERVPEGYAGCQDRSDPATNTPLPIDREVETPIIRLSRPDLGEVDRRHPPGIPADFPPYRTPTDSAAFEWPVFLGQIQRRREKPDAPYTFSVDPSGRPYAGLVGEDIVHPANTAAVHLGSPDEDGSRFAVSLCDVSGDLVPRLEITDQNELVFYGPTRLYDELIVDGGELAFTFAEEVQADAAPSPVPHAWQMYSWYGPTVLDDGSQHDAQQLRLEIAEAGEPLTPRRVTIGAWGKRRDATGAEVEQFWPCLSIADDCSVHVYGNLIMDGFLQPGSGGDTGQGRAGTGGAGGAMPAAGQGAVGQGSPRMAAAQTGFDLVESEESDAVLAARSAAIAGMFASTPPSLDATNNEFGVNTLALKLMLTQPEGIGQTLDLLSSDTRTLAEQLVQKPLAAQVVAQLSATQAGRKALGDGLLTQPDNTSELLVQLLAEDKAQEIVGKALTAEASVQNGAQALIKGLADDARIKAFAEAVRGVNLALAEKLATFLGPPSTPLPVPALPARRAGQPGVTPAAPLVEPPELAGEEEGQPPAAPAEPAGETQAGVEASPAEGGVPELEPPHPQVPQYQPPAPTEPAALAGGEPPEGPRPEHPQVPEYQPPGPAESTALAGGEPPGGPRPEHPEVPEYQPPAPAEPAALVGGEPPQAPRPKSGSPRRRSGKQKNVSASDESGVPPAAPTEGERG